MLKAHKDSLADGLATGRTRASPPLQAETDAKWRDKAFDAAVARGAGEPVRTLTPMGGVSAPLPLGGPSRKQRDRERKLGEELARMRAERQIRIDSILAARKRRADSLQRAADSIRP